MGLRVSKMVIVTVVFDGHRYWWIKKPGKSRLIFDFVFF